jgi:hypothetical protein
MQTERITLHFPQGSSDKVSHLQPEEAQATARGKDATLARP